MTSFKRCEDLIGLEYVPAADGTDNKIDCIWLVYKVLDLLKVPTPAFNWKWYDNDSRLIFRSLLQWGKRITSPFIDGDVLILPDDNWAFAVVWQGGFLHINPITKKTAWSPLDMAGNCLAFRCSRLNAS